MLDGLNFVDQAQAIVLVSLTLIALVSLLLRPDLKTYLTILVRVRNFKFKGIVTRYARQKLSCELSKRFTRSRSNFASPCSVT